MPGLLGLLDLISAPSPEQARGLLSDLVAGPRNRLAGLLSDPSGFLQSALADVVPTDQQTQEQLARYRMPASQDYAMGPSEYDNKLRDIALGALTVYHGSPHKFDKFDMSKIGTGEGAQAYGHGLYMAEAPGVAKQYADTLSSYHIATKDGVKGGGDFADALVANAGEYPSSLSSAIRSQANKIATDLANGKPAEQIVSAMRNGPYARIYSGLADAVENLSPSKAVGSLYKVDLPDESIAKMLDWDKPLSQQAPEVQKAMRSAFDEMYGSAQYGEKNFNQAQGMTGGELINFFRNREAASQAMNSAGIPGIRYLDGGSRNAGQGTYNYVVFDDTLPTILERNGQKLK